MIAGDATGALCGTIDITRRSGRASAVSGTRTLVDRAGVGVVSSRMSSRGAVSACAVGCVEASTNPRVRAPVARMSPGYDAPVVFQGSEGIAIRKDGRDIGEVSGFTGITCRPRSTIAASAILIPPGLHALVVLQGSEGKLGRKDFVDISSTRRRLRNVFTINGGARA